MKLRGKMQLIIGGIVLVAMIAVGIISSQFSYKSTMKVVSDSMTTSTMLASDEISSRIADYMNIASATGVDAVLTSGASDAVKSERIDKLAEIYGFTSGNVLSDKGISLKDGTDFSERDYVIQALEGNVNVSDITLSKYTNTYGFSVAAPLVSDSGRIIGVVYYRMDVDFIKAITSSINISSHSYAYIVDGDGMVIVHPDESLITELNVANQSGALGSIGKRLVAGETGEGTYSYNNQTIMCGYAPLTGTNGWSIVIAAPESDFSQVINEANDKLYIIIAALAIVAMIAGGLYAGAIAGSITKVKDSLEKVAIGDFSEKLRKSSKKDEIGVLINSTYSLQETLKGIIGETGRILGAMAEYNLTSDSMKEYPGEFNNIACAVNDINIILRQLISEVKESANCVGVGARELADAAESLSQGTVAQANSIQVVAGEVEDIAARIENTSGNEATVNNKLNLLDTQIKTGNTEMEALLNAVKEVEAMSNDISKIVGTIDSIAFQTNILALNAAVEAASAGEHGKGFAVVADEIGSLATKCSDSSKQTEELINKCIERIEVAKSSADTTFDCLTGVVSNSDEISSAFVQINADTNKLTSDSANIKREVNNIADIIQNNTAASEQTAAASETLSEQAANLNELIMQFRL